MRFRSDPNKALETVYELYEGLQCQLFLKLAFDWTATLCGAQPRSWRGKQLKRLQPGEVKWLLKTLYVLLYVLRVSVEGHSNLMTWKNDKLNVPSETRRGNHKTEEAIPSHKLMLSDEVRLQQAAVIQTHLNILMLDECTSPAG